MVLQDVLSLGDYLAEAGAVDPISAALLALGNVLLIFSIGAFVVLTVGGVLGALRSD